jgi:uncharacterized protein (DUF885 family)
MTKLILLRSFTALSVIVGSFSGFSQSKEHDYVPCEEMPNLMQNYNADYRALARYYSPASAQRGFGGGADASAGSPEKRQRLEQLNKDYLKKLNSISFKTLSQECKVDYILFKRDLNERIRLSAEDAKSYANMKAWLPFADKIYNLEKIRRRGGQPDAEKVAKE